MFNLVVPKHFYMNSNPVIVIVTSHRFEELSGGDVSVHTSHCANSILLHEEHCATEDSRGCTKALDGSLQEKHAVNATGFSDA